MKHSFLWLFLPTSMVFALACPLPGGRCEESATAANQIEKDIAELEKARVSQYAFVLQLLVQKKDFDGAAELIRRALLIPPTEEEDAEELKTIVADVAAGFLREEKSPEKSSRLCEDVIEALGEDPILLCVWSFASEELGEKQKADGLRQRAEGIQSDDQAYWFSIASHLTRKVGMKAGLEAYEKVAGISPEKPTHFNADSEAAMAHILCTLGDYDGSLRHCENLREIARKIVVSRTDIAMLTARVYAERAREAEVQEKYEEAIEDYKRSAEFSPQPGSAYNAIGEICLALKKYDEAKKWFQQGLAAGAAALAYVGLGDVQKALGNMEQAEEEYTRAEKAFAEEIDQDPDEAVHYNNFAWFYATHDRQLDKGIELVKRAIELAPKTPAYLDTLAELYYRTGDREAAIREIGKAIALEPPHRKYYQDQLQKFQNK